MVYKQEIHDALEVYRRNMAHILGDTDCKEYDAEKHCCPRFNRAIRNALKDAQPERKGKWIIHPEVKKCLRRHIY